MKKRGLASIVLLLSSFWFISFATSGIRTVDSPTGLFLFGDASAAASQPAGLNMKTVDDVSDKRIGVTMGTIFDSWVAENYPSATILRFESTADMAMALKAEKIDVIMMDTYSSRVVMKTDQSIGVLDDDVLRKPLGVGFSKSNPALRLKFNSFLAEIRSNGVYDQMYNRWFNEDPEQAVMPDIEGATSGDKIVVGVSVADLPYVAYMNNQYVGFDIEMIERFAAHEGMQLEFETMEFASLVAALSSGKVGMVSDGMAITEERGKQIDFSDPYVELTSGFIALKKNLAAYEGYEEAVSDQTPSGWLESIGDSFYRNVIKEDRYVLLIDGLKVTFTISVLAIMLGTGLGGLICFMRMSGSLVLRSIARAYIALIRGTPVLVLLMITFYVVFASVNIEPAIVAVIVFGLNFAAYVAEMYRTAIESIDKGQTEAGIAGGFSPVQTFVYIVMPQAIRIVLPVYSGEIISLVKMTSIVGYIAVQDLTKAGDIIRSRTFDAFFPLIVVAILYFAITWTMITLLARLQKSVDPRHRRDSSVVQSVR